MDKINLNDFQKRKFKDFYICLYITTKEIKIRTDTSMTNKDLYVLFGIDIMGNKQILGMYFDNKYDNRFWLEKFEDIKARNLKNTLFLVTSPNKNIERCFKIIYNDVEIIHSPDSICESIMQFFAEHPSRKMQTALKNLFIAKDKEKYNKELELFKEIYIDNKLIKILLDKKQEEIEKFYQYDHDLRVLFYPHYTIKDLKKYLNKLRTKEELCTNLNEVIEFCLPYINSFELGRNYSKVKWLELVSNLYEQYSEKLEEYLNG